MMIWNTLRARLRARPVGLCVGCECSVRADDAFRPYGTGVAHRECLEYVPRERRTRVPPGSPRLGRAEMSE